jgi:hypothetical protein
MSEESPTAKPSLKERLERLIAEYGKFVLPLYFGIFFLTWTGFAFAIQSGFQVESATAGVGTWAAAYVATKLTQPIRIGATFLLTPLVARLFGKRKSELAPDQPPSRD